MITINGEKRHLPFAPIRSGPWLGGVPWHNIGELEYGMEKFAGWVVPDVRENDLGKRSWDNMGRPPPRRVCPGGPDCHRDRTLVIGVLG